MTARRPLVAILLAFVLLALAACGGPPEPLKSKAEGLPDRIEAAKNDLKKTEKSYEKKRASEEFAFAQEYSGDQMRTDRFSSAKVSIDTANSLLKKGVKPLVDNYEDKDEAKLKKLLDDIDESLKSAKADMKVPAEWLSVVRSAKDDPERFVTEAETASTDYENRFKEVTTAVGSAKKQFPDQPKIDEKFSPVKTTHDQSAAALASLNSEVKKPEPNYAIVAGSADTVTTTAASTALAEFKDELDGLPVRETHTLIDIRVDSTLYVWRTSWDESYDGGEHDYAYPGIPVDTVTANYFAKFGIGTVLAKLTTTDNWRGKQEFKMVESSKDEWEKLNIDPKAKWPDDSDSDAEFYMDGLEDVYCHKLKVLKNGQPDTSGRPNDDDACSQYDTEAEIAEGIYWMESDELFSEAIGMDVYAKAYGDFSDQAITAATPPGLAYVGDPETGEWRQDDSGNSFWYYYGLYRFYGDLIGGPYPYYYRSDYDRWNRDYRYAGKSFYDTDSSGTPRFGGKSPQTASRFPNSSFVRTGLSTATIRNSGPVARAGGPGGGGK